MPTTPSKIAAVAFILSLGAIITADADVLSLGTLSPFTNAVENYTDCDHAASECASIARQMRAVIAAMGAALCTLATVVTKARPIWRTMYGLAAAGMAFKAAFHQMMHITGGEIALPLVIGLIALMMAAVLIPIALLTEENQE